MGRRGGRRRIEPTDDREPLLPLSAGARCSLATALPARWARVGRRFGVQHRARPGSCRDGSATLARLVYRRDGYE